MRIIDIGLAVPLVLCGLAACVGSQPPAETPDPGEYDDQAEYGSTPTHGPGAEGSSGYYGVGSSEPAGHQPASPSPGGHDPY